MVTTGSALSRFCLNSYFDSCLLFFFRQLLALLFRQTQVFLIVPHNYSFARRVFLAFVVVITVLYCRRHWDMHAIKFTLVRVHTQSALRFVCDTNFIGEHQILLRWIPQLQVKSESSACHLFQYFIVTIPSRMNAMAMYGENKIEWEIEKLQCIHSHKHQHTLAALIVCSIMFTACDTAADNIKRWQNGIESHTRAQIMVPCKAPNTLQMTNFHDFK